MVYGKCTNKTETDRAGSENYTLPARLIRDFKDFNDLKDFKVPKDSNPHHLSPAKIFSPDKAL